MRLLLVLGTSCLLLTSCSSKPKLEKPTPEVPKISVLTYNVENLFDNEHDEGKNDDAFLSPEEKEKPSVANRCRAQNSGRNMYECLEKDWSSPIVERKLKRIADVVAQIDDGRGPDILIMQEVENAKILSHLRDKYLAKMNYRTLILLEGPDERGIDTAILSRLPEVNEAKLHLIDFTKEPLIKPENTKPTRGILEAHLRLPNDETLAVFAVHFPSQGAETIFRKVALQRLLEVTAQVPPHMKVLVGGDFNITSKEDWKQKYFRDMVSPRFAVSHMIGCDNCPGSIYYPPDKTWSFFDVLLFSRDMYGGNSGWQVDTASINLKNKNRYQINRFGTPARFGSGKSTVGVSDHWPMYAEIKLLPSHLQEVQ